MKKTAATICALIMFLAAIAQHRDIDSLTPAFRIEKTDTEQIKILYRLSAAYLPFKLDTTLMIAQQALTMAEEKKFLAGQC